MLPHFTMVTVRMTFGFVMRALDGFLVCPSPSAITARYLVEVSNTWLVGSGEIRVIIGRPRLIIAANITIISPIPHAIVIWRSAHSPLPSTPLIFQSITTIRTNSILFKWSITCFSCSWTICPNSCLYLSLCRCFSIWYIYSPIVICILT